MALPLAWESGQRRITAEQTAMPHAVHCQPRKHLFAVILLQSKEQSKEQAVDALERNERVWICCSVGAAMWHSLTHGNSHGAQLDSCLVLICLER